MAQTGIHEWSVTFSNTTKVGATELLFSGIPNGSYPFIVDQEVGYLSNPYHGWIAVNGSNVTESITFSTNGPPASSGFPGTYWYAVIGGAAVAFGLGVLVGIVWKRRGRVAPGPVETSS